MLKNLLLTAALISSTYGADPLLATDTIDSKTQNSKIALETSTTLPVNTSDLLNSLRLRLTQPEVKIEDVIFAIAELSKKMRLTEHSIYDIYDGSIDHFKFAFQIKIDPSEIQEFIEKHSGILQSALFIPQLNFSETQWSEYTWFIYILIALNNDTDPSMLSAHLSDTALSQIETWLSIPQDTVHLLTFFSLLRLIDLVQKPEHVERMQKIALKHLDDFLNQGKNIPMFLLKLASLKSDYTFTYIYELHRLLIKKLYEEIAMTSHGEVEPIAHRAVVLILLTNYRDDVLEKVLDHLKFNTLFKRVLETVSVTPKIQESKLVQEGKSSLSVTQPTVKVDQEVNKFLLELGLDYL